MFKQGDQTYIDIEAVDEDAETTNITVSLDGVEIANQKAMIIILVDTRTLGGHILKINCTNEEGLVGKE